MDTSAQSFARDLSKLFSEYASKLDRFLTELHEAKTKSRERKQDWASTSEQQEFRNRFFPMHSALQTATREASQLAEQGAVDDTSRLELKIRLAEVEGLGMAIMTSINSAQ